jgi:RimJ/RimL family protein N-acetyltransferase
MDLQFRLASTSDIFRLIELYHVVYQGTYPEPLMNQSLTMKKFIETTGSYWFIAESKSEVNKTDIVASVVIQYDPENRLAKAFGAAVLEEFRRAGLMESLLKHAIEYMQNHTLGADVVYATTRTVHEGAQALTERLGFKKLGIFPNSHKSSEYETHCLAAVYHQKAIENRFQDYSLHEKLRGLVQIVTEEVPEMAKMKFITPELPSKILIEPPQLEIVTSEHFVKYRYEKLKKEKELQFAFFPFHEPNILVLSPDQTVEIFCYHSPNDAYSVIIGGKVDPAINYSSLFNTIANLLRDQHASYVEILVRADKPKIIESILKAKFIPSAFFPAFQLHKGQRYDYVVMNKTFEIFDFQNIRLKGLNLRYLEEYFDHWKLSALNPKMIQDFSTHPREAYRRPSPEAPLPSSPKHQ